MKSRKLTLVDRRWHGSPDSGYVVSRPGEVRLHWLNCRGTASEPPLWITSSSAWQCGARPPGKFRWRRGATRKLGPSLCSKYHRHSALTRSRTILANRSTQARRHLWLRPGPSTSKIANEKAGDSRDLNLDGAATRPMAARLRNNFGRRC